AIVGNAKAGSRSLDEAETLLSAVGEVVRLSEEAQIDAVTGVSGSGPAYVFHMIECMAAAGVAQGLPEEL
ncbi:pyrroline-5-carboxylate reductase dimerization domain-containing protein, partial [Sulfitobacter sp. HI0021]